MSQPPASGRLPPLAVIADDLTGSCDTAAQFCRYGMRVAMTGLSAPDLGPDLDLLVVNTASRGLPVERSRQVAARSCRSLLRLGCRPVYKKIDSTLKGPWCQEVAAVMAVVRPDLAIVAPAFPAWGRTSRGGRLLLDSRPPPPRPARGAGPSGIDSGDLLGRLRAEFGSQVELLRRDLLRRPPAVVEKHIQTARRKGHRVLLFDIESDSELERLALVGRRLDEAVLWVGSAGLARFLPLSWGRSPGRMAPSGPQVQGPVLLICGSLNPVNKAQLEQLGRRGLATVITLWDEDTNSPLRADSKLKPALEALAHKQSAALCLRLGQRIRSRSHLQRLQQALQSAAGRLLDTGALGATILVGGDTALKVYEQCDAKGIRVQGDVEPGIPWGRWIGGRLDGLPLVTKAGGFGNPETLCDIAHFLTGGPATEDVL
ncbi:MAG: hypothetical protein OXI69_12920 [Acidobacteriota bacterium]|nr:hypothetical protein [Acidobacteriota bacterium]